jgi:two-component system chemotaxis response regulator CheB
MSLICRVLIVERGASVSRFARPLFAGRVVEVGPPVDYSGIVEAVTRYKPQLVLVDLEAHALEAVAAVETLMAKCPTPILLLSGSGSKQETIRALAAGALDAMEKPAKFTPEFFKTLTSQVQLLARVSVLRHVRGSRTPVATGSQPPFRLVAIASSLGGPKALVRVLMALPKSFAAPIVICQHITAGFADELARWLKSETKRDVIEATRALPLAPNRIFIAGSEAHLLARPDFTIDVDPSPPVGGFRPSCDVLLRSVAACFGEHAIGVVLTGMGRDGARGLKEIRSRGGHTIAQDEASSVVFGMPGEAIALGAAELILPLDEIAAQLGRWA